jgi:hypothetical protein
MIYVVNGAAERIAYPGKVRFYYDENKNFIVEVLDEELIEK